MCLCTARKWRGFLALQEESYPGKENDCFGWKRDFQGFLAWLSPVFSLQSVCGGLIVKSLTHKSANRFLHLLLFLKPVQPPVVKTETIAQQQTFPEIQFCRTKAPERLVLCVMDAFSAHSLSFDKEVSRGSLFLYTPWLGKLE